MSYREAAPEGAPKTKVPRPHTPLTKRIGTAARTVVDPSAPTTSRVAAMGALGAGTAAPVVGTILGEQVLNRVDPHLVAQLTSVPPTAGITAAVALPLAGIVTAVGLGTNSGYPMRQRRTATELRHFYGRTSLVCYGGAAVAGALALGFAGGDLAGLSTGATAQVFTDIALSTGIVGAVAHANDGLFRRRAPGKGLGGP